MQTLILSAITFPVLIVLDLIWIGGIGNSFYRTHMGSMFRPDIVYPAALAFYVAYALALAFFVVTPNLHGSLWRVVLVGAFFGFAAYATYDFTNWATLTGWPPIVSIVDLAWGTFATAVTSSAVYLIATKVLGY